MAKSIVTALPGGGADIEEPKWNTLIPNFDGPDGDNSVWREFAHREWLRVSAELREAGTLASANRHQMQRLIIAYVRYDQTCAERFRMGLITKAPRSDTAQMNIAQTELRQADADATTAEMELGITPRRRASVGKARRAEKVQRPSDRYLAKSAL
jgi:P27 family predicted phage terminase small subunit